jgi:hypothetical protein
MVIAPRPQGRRAGVSLVFGLEWLAAGALVLLDLLLAPHIHFHVTWSWRDATLPAALLAAALATRRFGYGRTSLVLEYVALYGVAISALCVLTYLSLALSGPLVDTQLQALDHMLGFDWLSLYRIYAAHPWTDKFLTLLYKSPPVQILYFCLLFGLMSDKTRLRQLFWLFLSSLLLTCLGVYLYPAYGPFKVFGLEAHGTFLPVMEHLRSGHDLTFSLAHMTGVICFPSFHTTMALAFVYAFRRTGIIGICVTGINSAMLFAIPFVGGHYLIDMIAGAGVALVSIAAVAWCPFIWKGLAATVRRARPAVPATAR